MRVIAEMFPARKSQVVELKTEANGFDLLKGLGLAPDAHLLLRAGNPIPLDEPLAEGERLRILAVVSGGLDPPGSLQTNVTA